MAGFSIDTSGFDDTIKMLEKLTEESEGMMKQSVYKGAGVVADDMKSIVKGLRTQSDNRRTDVRYPYDYEKAALIENLGIAPIGTRGSVNTKIGFDGYYTNKRGDQRPVPLLANSINAGTTFLKKQPFLSQTKRKSEKNCIEAMQKQLDKSIEELTK